jgi:hypothetical protein
MRCELSSVVTSASVVKCVILDKPFARVMHGKSNPEDRQSAGGRGEPPPARNAAHTKRSAAQVLTDCLHRTRRRHQRNACPPHRASAQEDTEPNRRHGDRQKDRRENERCDQRRRSLSEPNEYRQQDERERNRRRQSCQDATGADRRAQAGLGLDVEKQKSAPTVHHLR